MPVGLADSFKTTGHRVILLWLLVERDTSMGQLFYFLIPKFMIDLITIDN